MKFLLFADEDFQDSDPPKVLVIGPDSAGNMIELIGRFTNDNHTLVVFHAMAARPQLLRLLTDTDQ